MLEAKLARVTHQMEEDQKNAIQEQIKRLQPEDDLEQFRVK